VTNDTDEVGGPTLHQSITDSDISGRTGARHEQPLLPASYAEHMQHIVESYDRWNDAVSLLDTMSCSGLYC